MIQSGDMVTIRVPMYRGIGYVTQVVQHQKVCLATVIRQANPLEGSRCFAVAQLDLLCRCGRSMGLCPEWMNDVRG
jgi:hypothetical protein